MSNSTIGVSLAEAVARHLEAGHKLAHSHPEYCGMGLHCVNGVFIYCEVYDGDLLTETQYHNQAKQGDAPEFLAFAERAQFVAWLAGQSDQSLAGLDAQQDWRRNNQRLSLQRLQEFIQS